MNLRRLMGRVMPSGRTGEGSRRPSRRRLRPGVDRLDERMLLTADVTAALRSGALTVKGTAQGETIEVYKLDNKVVVRSADATGSSVVGSFDAKKVKSIGVKAGNGDDTIRVDKSLQAIAKVDGQKGADTTEWLSADQFLNVTASLDSSGALTVKGSAQGETIEVYELDNKVVVRSANATGSNVVGSFDAKKVKSIGVKAGDGDDTIRVDESLEAIARVDGEEGADTTEWLSAYELLNVTASLDSAGVLTVRGTSQPDVIFVHRDVTGSKIIVEGVGSFDSSKVKFTKIQPLESIDTVTCDYSLAIRPGVDRYIEDLNLLMAGGIVQVPALSKLSPIGPDRIDDTTESPVIQFPPELQDRLRDLFLADLDEILADLDEILADLDEILSTGILLIPDTPVYGESSDLDENYPSHIQDPTGGTGVIEINDVNRFFPSEFFVVK